MTNEAASTTFATCSYIEFDPSYGIPVKSTVGHPRFKLRYQLAANWQHAAPDRAALRLEPVSFRRCYTEKLRRFGSDYFGDRAAELRASARRDEPVVLLCFDKLWLPDAFCHRTIFAEWFQSLTGEQVPELGRTA